MDITLCTCLIRCTSVVLHVGTFGVYRVYSTMVHIYDVWLSH